MTLYKNGAFIDDPWRHIRDGEAPSAAGHVIFPLEWWQVEKQTFEGSNVALGLRLEPGERLDEVLAELPRFQLIALAFPKFGDGRAFSTATLLRERHGFKGELRAVGEVLLDQIQPMLRCGFDAFEINDPFTEKHLREGRVPGVAHFYQPGLGAETKVGARPWTRRWGAGG
jgi:phosphoadenosine phosphosulfate reductase